ncbi:MAG: hypothetical protein WAT25_05205 [Paracoccaceae bacterium]|jgi:hypothetical protein|nr:hypothetical protein [Rhodobacter sp.]
MYIQASGSHSRHIRCFGLPAGAMLLPGFALNMEGRLRIGHACDTGALRQGLALSGQRPAWQRRSNRWLPDGCAKILNPHGSFQYPPFRPAMLPGARLHPANPIGVFSG